MSAEGRRKALAAIAAGVAILAMAAVVLTLIG